MIAFIDDHREVYGVEPICGMLRIAPSTYHAHVAQRADPARASPRARQDLALMEQIRRVHAANFGVYGARKVWRQLAPGGHRGGPLHGGTPDAADGPAWRRARQGDQDHDRRQGGALPGGQGEPAVPGAAAERAVGVGFHLRGDLAGLRLRRLRHRCLRPPHRRLAGVAGRRMRISSSMPWSRRCTTAVPRRAASSITATGAANLGSSGRRNTSLRRSQELVKGLGRRPPHERLAWPAVERCRHREKRCCVMSAQVRALREVLPQ